MNKLPNIVDYVPYPRVEVAWTYCHWEQW